MDTNTGYYIADAAHPLICTGPLWEELLLCHIHSERHAELCECFERISGKAIRPGSILSELSGGQKVILMLCLAVISPAQSICFIDLEHSLDPAKLTAAVELIGSSGKSIRWQTAP